MGSLGFTLVSIGCPFGDGEANIPHRTGHSAWEGWRGFGRSRNPYPFSDDAAKHRNRATDEVIANCSMRLDIFQDISTDVFREPSCFFTFLLK